MGNAELEQSESNFSCTCESRIGFLANQPEEDARLGISQEENIFLKSSTRIKKFSTTISETINTTK